MTAAGTLSGLDFTDLDNFGSGFPHELFAIHRRVAPVFWHVGRPEIDQVGEVIVGEQDVGRFDVLGRLPAPD